MDPQAIMTIGLYAGINALIMWGLFVNALRNRSRSGVSFGDGGDEALVRAMRGQANAAENVPITLLLLLILALMGAQNWLLHTLGIALTAGRLMHALYFVWPGVPLMFRIVGTVLTVTTIVVAAIRAIGVAFLSMV
ncbi:MAG: MAPEG family protein [Stappiaceae bacterium]